MKPPTIQKISDWHTLQDWLDIHASDSSPTSWAFRGEPDATHSTVLPTIDREPRESWGNDHKSLHRRLLAECDSIDLFKRHASIHLADAELAMLRKPTNFQTQIVMRHFGVPTRILDWTYSCWIALYFACSKDFDKPGRILLVPKSRTQLLFKGRYKTEWDEAVRLDQDGYPHLLSEEFATTCSNWMCFFHGLDAYFPRLTAQQGFFSIASKPWLDHFHTARTLLQQAGWSGQAHAVHINASLKRPVLRRLHDMGINGMSMYPDIFGVASHLSERLQWPLTDTSPMTNHHRIDYIELGATDMAASKAFYTAAFGWPFTDYGPDYASFDDGRLSGGVTTQSPAGPGGALVVLYSDDLEASRESVTNACGTIVKDIFDFPGGRRFEFTDPAKNRLAVWTDDAAKKG